MRAYDCKKRICVIQGGELGGAGIHSGALSSKTMWELSNDYRQSVATTRGYKANSVRLYYSKLQDIIRKAQQTKSEQMLESLTKLNVPLVGL